MAGVTIRVASLGQVWPLKGMAKCRAVRVDMVVAAKLQARSGVNLALVASAMLAMDLGVTKDKRLGVEAPSQSTRIGCCHGGGIVRDSRDMCSAKLSIINNRD